MARIRIALLALALLLALPATAGAAGDGVIKGHLQNLTAGGAVPAGVAVTLRVFRNGTFDREDSAVAAPDGTFVFEALDTGPEWAYRLLAVHGGGVFSGDIISFAASPVIAATLGVYDPAAADPGLRAVQHSLVLTPGGNRSLGALHLLTLELPGDRAYIPAALDFALPAGFFDFRPLGGFEAAELSDTADGFAAMLTLTPGTNEFTYSYLFPWDPGGTRMTLAAGPPGEATIVLARAGDLTITGTTVQVEEAVPFQGMTLESWRVGPAASGATTVWLRDTASVGLLAAVGRVPAGAWGGAGMLLFGLLLAFAIARGGHLRAARQPADRAEVERLLEEMAKLDRRAAESGERRRNRERRAAAKATLLDRLRGDESLLDHLELPGSE
jgi:hypothetical protein